MRFPLSRPVRSRPVLTAFAVLAAAGATSLATAASASAHQMLPGPSADERQAFVMHEQVDHSTESYTFTSSGPLCPSGRVADHVTVESANAADTVVVWHVDTTYTCDDGSGTFTAIKHLVRHQFPDHAWNIGTVRITGGTGAYAGLEGFGVDWGASANGQGAGVTHGHLWSDEEGD